jgi:hypothetical protein
VKRSVAVGANANKTGFAGMKRLLGFAALSAALILGGPARAEKGGWHYYDPDCPIAVGPITVKFLAMQPKRSTDKNCDELSDKGAAVLVFDSHESEAQDLIWDIRILRDSHAPDGEENLDRDTVQHEPPQKYRNGMVSLDHYFREGGDYLAMVTLTSDDGAKKYIGRHRFSVAAFDPLALIAYVLFGAASVGVVGFLSRPYWRKKA